MEVVILVVLVIIYFMFDNYMDKKIWVQFVNIENDHIIDEVEVLKKDFYAFLNALNPQDEFKLIDDEYEKVCVCKYDHSEYQKEIFIAYEMLKILQDIVQNKEVDLEEWVQKYRGVELGWDFDILDEWIDGFDEGEVKERLREAMGVFKGHG